MCSLLSLSSKWRDLVSLLPSDGLRGHYNQFASKTSGTFALYAQEQWDRQNMQLDNSLFRIY